MRPIIDSHLDLAWNALSWRRDLRLPLEILNARESHLTDERARGCATTSLPELRQGGVKLVFGTLIARTPRALEAPLSPDHLDYPAAINAHAAAQGRNDRKLWMRAVGTPFEVRSWVRQRFAARCRPRR